MNIIFLDIDGVLIPDNSYNHLNLDRVFSKPFNYLDDLVHCTPLECINSLQLLVNERKAQFVLISSWRQLFEEDFLQEYLTQVGLFHYFHKDWIAYTPHASKGKDINIWLSTHDVEEWWIIDDEDTSITNYGFRLSEHLIRPNPKDGYAHQKQGEQHEPLRATHTRADLSLRLQQEDVR